MGDRQQGPYLLFLLAASLITQLHASSDRGLLARTTFKSGTSATGTGAKSRASASTSATGSSGNIFVRSTATSEVDKNTQSEIQKKVKNVVKIIPKKKRGTSKQAYCTAVGETIRASAKAIAEIGLRASVKTLTTVRIEGVGQGCGDASGEASTSATAFANAIVTAWVRVKKANYDANADADLQSIAKIFASVAASAASTACSSNDGSAGTPSFAQAYQDVVATAYIKAAASILVWLEASIDCEGTGDAYIDANTGSTLKKESAEVTGQAGAEVIGVGDAQNVADGSATTAKVKPCKNIPDVAVCCNRKNKRSSLCYCTANGKRSRGRKLDACVATKTVTNRDIIWEYTLKNQNADGGVCSC